MLTYPEIDPIIFQLGPLAVRWYGLMYLLGIGAGWLLLHQRCRRADIIWQKQQVDDLVFYATLGVVLGGRVGYVLFYNLQTFWDDPIYLFRVWQGGMSFHGGLLGVLLAMWLLARREGQSFFTVTDFLAPVVPLGLLAGRIGNFINGELWGGPTDLPWGMQVSGSALPLHPSQLYEAGLEGVVLFVLLWWYSSKPRPRMAISALFLLGYGCFRFAVEFVRLPDYDIGYLAFGWLTMGQLLSLPMIVFGVYLWQCSRAYTGQEN